jgi:predicted ATPase
MIHYVRVNGFRSLANFEFEIRPGLNVLVGPNGSGKTNIVLFFSFLSALVSSSLSEAVGRLGGAGSVFRKLGQQDFERRLDCEIYGVLTLARRRHCIYRYSFCAELVEGGAAMLFRNQKLSATIRTVPKTQGVKNWDVEIERLVGEKGKLEHKVAWTDRSDRILTSSHERYFMDRGRVRIEKMSQQDARQNIVAQLDSEDPDAGEPLLRSAVLRTTMTTAIRFALLRDLTSGSLINIVPSRVRLPEDSAKAPGIQQDGSGLYATLFALSKALSIKKRRLPHDRTPELIRRVPLKDITDFVAVANPAIKSLQVENNAFDNQVQVRVVIGQDKVQSVLPLSAMSDGTLKWLALITAIKTARSPLSIEEPENYLHPLMQREILNIIRSSLEKTQFSLLTTHSETVLNNADPGEVVVVAFKDGATTVFRTQDAEELRGEINNTGFGLGYYYLAGTLDPDPTPSQ